MRAVVDGLGVHPGRTGGRGDVAASQSGLEDHRRSQGCGEDRELSDEAADLRVAVGGPLLGVAVDLADRVVEVDQREPVGLVGADDEAGDLGGESGQDPPGDVVELLDVAVGERAKVGTQGRGRPEAVEEPAHRALTQQVEVIDAAGTGEHPTDHTGRFRDRVRRVHVLLEEIVQASGFGPPQRRHPPRWIRVEATPDLMGSLLLQNVINSRLSADSVAGAERGRATPGRTAQCNGYRHRPLDSRVGTIDVAVPKLRQGSYDPEWLLERRKRAESALITVVADCYLAGISTRRMDKLVKQLAIDSL